MPQKTIGRRDLSGADLRLYTAWQAMRQRCNNPKYPCYSRYGGRGITHDPSWDDFVVFAAYVGAHPGAGWTLDRIYNDDNYRPGNVRWATRKTQGENRNNQMPVALRSAIRADFAGGMRQCEIIIKYGITSSQVSRLVRGAIW